MKKVNCTKEEYQEKMDEFRREYGHVWNAPKWARDEIRKLRIVEDRPEFEQLDWIERVKEEKKTDPRDCNTGVTLENNK